jgi:hypothetical protein
MPTGDKTVCKVSRRLTFLDGGGCRVRTLSRVPLFFGDLPIYRKRSDGMCSRHIPQNAAGETLHTMYSTATAQESEATVRSWLLRAINEPRLRHGKRGEQESDCATPARLTPSLEEVPHAL